MMFISTTSEVSILSIVTWLSLIFWIVIFFCVLGPVLLWFDGESNDRYESTYHGTENPTTRQRSHHINQLYDLS